MCVKILSDLMELLFRAEAGQTIDDISLIMKTILRTVIQTIIRLPRDDEQAVHLLINSNAVHILKFIFIRSARWCRS
jgi:dedicator of cytokinesis protein 1